jgi:molecular chaperone DnaK (HSP70)
LADNIKLAEATLTGLPPNLPKGEPIHIRFQLDEDGTLEVHTWMPNQGNKEAKITMKTSDIMSEEELKGRDIARDA